MHSYLLEHNVIFKFKQEKRSNFTSFHLFFYQNNKKFANVLSTFFKYIEFTTKIDRVTDSIDF